MKSDLRVFEREQQHGAANATFAAALYLAERMMHVYKELDSLGIPFLTEMALDNWET